MGPKLFSSPRAYDDSLTPNDLMESRYIEIDESDYGADRHYDKRHGNPAHPSERDGEGKRHRAQADLRHNRFDFSQLLKHWK